jgi:hypothetical protein
VLLVNRWKKAICMLGGLAASALAFGLFGPTIAGLVLLATLWCGAFGTPVIGDTPVLGRATSVDPGDVRRYREEHPGATISDAVAAVTHR